MTAETTSSPAGPGLGAYGLGLTGVDEAARLLVPAEASWPSYALRSEVNGTDPARERVTDDAAELVLRDGCRVAVDRRAGSIVFRGPRMSAEELVHPRLAAPAAVASRWLGRESFHAAAIAVGARVAGVLGDRGAGKSSLAAWFALAGHTVVCDDTLVLDGLVPLAGPRSVDLREDAFAYLGAGEAMGKLGSRERWRLPLAQAPELAPVHGWVFLEWGDAVEVRPLAAAERLRRLLPQRAVRLPVVDGVDLLELAALPGWLLTRPRDWRGLAEGGRRIEELLS